MDLSEGKRQLKPTIHTILSSKILRVRLGFITLGRKVPSTRFRFLPYFPILRQHGHSCHLWMSYPSVYEHIPWMGWRISHAIKRSVRYSQLAAASIIRPDCIYLERGCLNDDSLDLDKSFRRRTRRLVLDVDDGIFLEKPDKIHQLIDISDHCIVSSSLIAEYVAPRHDHVTVIPTAVSMERYRPRPPAAGRSGKPRAVIGWIGTIPNMPFLGECAAALRQLAKFHDFELLVVGPSPDPLTQLNLEGVRVNFQTWRADLEIEHLHRMDIGLMPLPAGQEWMKYKAATKLVQYLAVGIPAVASPIGVNKLILEQNSVGLAATTTQEWVDALESLLANPELRESMGQAGRAFVAEHYSIEANAPRLEQVLCGEPPKP